MKTDGGAKYVRKRIHGFGFALNPADKGITQVLLKNRWWRKWPREPEFMDIIMAEVKEGMVAFDLGANIGYITMLLARLVGAKGHVYAVEPSPSNFENLNLNVRLNGHEDLVATYQTAISNRTGVTEFHVSEASNLCSLSASANTSRSIEVPVTTSDDFFKGKRMPNFIKMDIEGAEVEAIEGMLEVLRSAPKPVKILMEVHPMYYSKDHNFGAALLELFKIGFAPKYVISAATDRPPFLVERGYKPSRVYYTGDWKRGVYENIKPADVIESICKPHIHTVKLPLRSCLKRPMFFFNRFRKTDKIVRGLFLVKE